MRPSIECFVHVARRSSITPVPCSSGMARAPTKIHDNEDQPGHQPVVPSSPSLQPQQLARHSPSIVAFAFWHVATPTACLHEPGRLYCGCVGHHRAWSGSSQTVAMFPERGVGIVRQHPRDNGCEHQVFVHFTRAVSRVEGRLSLCSGRLRLFLSHWPSTSALVAVASFIRYFPSVRLEIHYDSALHDWHGKRTHRNAWKLRCVCV